MLGHVSLGVRDLARAALFYDAVLAALGYMRLWTGEGGLGYGRAGGGEKLNIFERAGASPPGEGFHLAFEAPDRAGVDRFHAAALAHGGTDAGVVVYDKSSGDILHTEDVAGPADRLADLCDGKLEARAYDFVKKGKAHGGAFEVMPVDGMQSVAEGKTLQIDPIARRVVEAAPKLVQVVSLNTPPVKKVKPGKSAK